MTDRRACSPTSTGMVERKILRRVAAILYHRRAGFSANGMGVWKVPDEQILEVGARMAAVRGISHCYERPTYAGLALLGLHDGPRPLEGGVRRDPRSRSPTSTGSTARTARSSTPRPSSRRSACTTSPTSTRTGSASTRRRSAASDAGLRRGLDVDTRTSEVLYARAVGLMPGGVNSPVRAMRSIGREHRSSSSAARASS